MSCYVTQSSHPWRHVWRRARDRPFMALPPPPLAPFFSNSLDESTPAHRIAGLAMRQHGVVAREQLINLGISPSTIGHWVSIGHLHVLHRGVYAVGHRRLTDEGRWLAAVLVCGESAALADVSAAELQRLLWRRTDGPVHVAIAGRGKRRPSGIRVHCPRSLGPRDLTTRDSIPVTTPTRTLFDLASSTSPSELRDLFERAEYLEVLDRRRLSELLNGATGRRGLGDLRALMGFESIPLSRTRSALERIVLAVCRDHGLPIPGVNVPLLGYEVDFHWPEARFVVEADGGRHVGARRDRDNERDIRLGRTGILVRRYSWEALKDRGSVGREIREILEERLP